MPDDDEITFGDEDVLGQTLPDITTPMWDEGSRDIRATALHEAGHVVALRHCSVSVKRAAIRAHVSDPEFGAVPGETEVDTGQFLMLAPVQRAACGLAGLYVEYINDGRRSSWIDWVSIRPPGRGDDDERRVRQLGLDCGIEYVTLADDAFAFLQKIQPPLIETAQSLAVFLLGRQEDMLFIRTGDEIDNHLHRPV